MSAVLTFLGLFALGGFAFGRVWRRFFRRRRIGVGRVLVGRLLLLSFLVIFGAMYVGLLNNDEPEAKLTDSERMVATWGLPIAFLLFAVIAYVIGTRARVVTKKPGDGVPIAATSPVAENDAWSQPTAGSATLLSPSPVVLPPPSAERLPPTQQPDGPRLPPRS